MAGEIGEQEKQADVLSAVDCRQVLAKLRPIKAPDSVPGTINRGIRIVRDL